MKWCSNTITVLTKYVLSIAFKNVGFVKTDVFKHAFYDF